MPPKKPVEILKLTGTLRHNKGRYESRRIPAAHGELGHPPGCMNIDAQACWHELAAMAPAGLLGRADRLAAEIAANLMAEFRRDPAGFTAAKTALLQRLLGKFAMIPGDRATMRLPEPPAEKDDPFAEFT